MRLETAYGRCMADTHGPSGVLDGRVRQGDAFCVRVGKIAICCYCFNRVLVDGMQTACADHWDDLLAGGTLGTDDAPGPDDKHWTDSLFADFYSDVREAFVSGGETPFRPMTPSCQRAMQARDTSGLLAGAILADAYPLPLR